MKPIERTDTDLQNAVSQEIAWLPSVNSAHIGVSANHGVVTLSGQVDSYPERYLAEKAARQVRGVNAVAEEITVRGRTGVSDTVIAQQAQEALERAIDVPKDSVQVTVQDRMITLTGNTAWHFQREAAARAVRYLNGVAGIHNKLVVKPEASVEGIGQAITDALTRDAQLESRSIRVLTEGGHVTLEGKVHSLAEKYRAGRAAWCAPGVIAMTNRLSIAP